MSGATPPTLSQSKGGHRPGSIVEHNLGMARRSPTARLPGQAGAAVNPWGAANDVTLYGRHGRVTGAAVGGAAGQAEVVSDSVNKVEVYPQGYPARFVAQLEDFHQAIAEAREPAASGLKGPRVVEVTPAVIRLAREGRTVRIEPVSV